VGRLSEPARSGAWLATTARRECLRLVARNRRTLPAEAPDPTTDPLYCGEPGPELGLLTAERAHEVQRAVGRLPPRCRELMQLLMAEPTPCYDAISAALGIPVGSIGPTRGRCLEKLKAIVAESGIEVVGAHSS
jgi:DNA-directed RNA polymerase specialized sigma24 family protein